jgi:hypothetical protein
VIRLHSKYFLKFHKIDEPANPDAVNFMIEAIRVELLTLEGACRWPCFLVEVRKAGFL